MPGLAGIHVVSSEKNVDGRDKPGHDESIRLLAVFNCFPPEIKPIRRPENVRIKVTGAFPVNVWPVIRQGP